MAVSSIGGTVGGTYGLSGSGIDVDSLVKKLMAGEQAKQDALMQKKTVLEWQKAAYNTVYDDISNFRNTVFNYKLQSTLRPNKVSSSNTSVATATAAASAADINHSLVVSRLASGVNLTSSDRISAANPPATGTLATQIYGNVNVPSPFQITIANGSNPGKTITIDPTNQSIYDVVSAINGAGINVQASYDSTLDRFFLATTNTGASTQIKITTTAPNGTTDAGADFIRKLKLFATSSSIDNGDGTTTTTFISSPGQDAAFTLDNTALTEATNTFTIGGVTYNLIGTGSTNISVTSDVDTAVANIQSLVDSYNKILAELNSKVNEPRYTDYPPLTDAQKAAMKDSDITLWNQKAQSGMLHNDDTLTSLIYAMRNAFANQVSGIASTVVNGKSITYNTAASIGITTGDYTEGGKLYLDTDKLRAALQANPDVLNQLFGATGQTTTDGKTKTNYQSQGIAGRLYDAIKNAMDQLNQIAGTTASSQYDTNSNLAKEIADYNMQISAETDRFNTIQSQYYTQFNAMEAAIQQLNAQSSWLFSQLGTGK